jgi:hypothetical protein
MSQTLLFGYFFDVSLRGVDTEGVKRNKYSKKIVKAADSLGYKIPLLPKSKEELMSDKPIATKAFDGSRQ